MTQSDELFSCLMTDLSGYLPAGFQPGDDWSPELSVTQVAAIQLVKSFYKKRNASRRSTPEGDAVAWAKFQRSNERCRTWTLAPNTSLDEELCGEFKNLLYRFFYPEGHNLVFSINDLFDRGRCGPGVAVGARGEDFYTKFFDSPLTSTSQALVTAYSNAVANDRCSTWGAAESNRAARYSEPELVLGSRFSFVPKDDTSSRLIAIEPSLNMFYQLGLGRLLEERLISFFGLDIASQSHINQEAARIGSVTDALATLDLSNASDSVGNTMLEWALPRSVWNLLVLLRSPSGERRDPVTGSSGGPLELHMVSTMGNGFTFPLETLVFSCVVVACIKSFGVKPVRPYTISFPEACRGINLLGYWGVYGDDIICHSRVALRVMRLLALLGFEVNRDKSFVEGVFRESCGRDYVNGHDVRGVYVKHLETPESRYAVINALNVWSAKVGIPLPKTVRRLVDSVRWLPIPPAENHDAGIRVPFSIAKDFVKRNNPMKVKNPQAIVYSRRTSSPKHLTIKDGEIRVPKQVKRRFFNPEGLLLAFLHGSIRDCRISLRQSDLRYHTKQGVTPYWDYVPPTSDIASLCGGSSWESLTEINLKTG
jgi:hypothetical protein